MDNSRTQKTGEPTDVGRTSGGGSLGHRQPPEVEREGPIRNNPPEEPRDEPSDPAMPKNDASLKIKI